MANVEKLEETQAEVEHQRRTDVKGLNEFCTFDKTV
jgi:hypothetical protein